MNLAHGDHDRIERIVLPGDQRLEPANDTSSDHDRIDRHLRLRPMSSFAKNGDVDGIGVRERITGRVANFSRR